MVTTAVTQLFTTDSPWIFDESDALMDVLVDHESQDPSVRDAAVSADSGSGEVIVEVVADGDDEQAAMDHAVQVIIAAARSVVEVAKFAGRVDATRQAQPMARLYCLIGSHGPYEVPVVELQDAECPRCAEVSQAMLDDAVAVAKAHLMPHPRRGGESR